MMRTAFSELPPVLNAKDIQNFLEIAQSSVYDLFHRADFPTLHVNSRLLVLKVDLLTWMKDHTNSSSVMYSDPSLLTWISSAAEGRAE